MIMLLLLDQTADTIAMAFNGPPYDASHLPEGYACLPRAITAAAPYPYAGMYVLGLSMISGNPGYDPAYDVMQGFLGTLSSAEIDPAQAWPSNGDAA